MIRVLIVDDHELVRLGLRSYLDTEPDITVVGEVADGASAVSMAEETQPDVVLMDLLMPGMSGVEATREIAQRRIPARVVILTSSLDDERMIQALRAGALSYLLKTSSAQTVVNAIRAAKDGTPVLDAAAQKQIVTGLHGQTVAGWDLTDREKDVLRGVAAGKNNQEIADDLLIGVKTVKTHVSNILAKLAVSDRTQAAIYAIRHHLD